MTIAGFTNSFSISLHEEDEGSKEHADDSGYPQNVGEAFGEGPQLLCVGDRPPIGHERDEEGHVYEVSIILVISHPLQLNVVVDPSRCRISQHREDREESDNIEGPEQEP